MFQIRLIWNMIWYNNLLYWMIYVKLDLLSWFLFKSLFHTLNLKFHLSSSSSSKNDSHPRAMLQLWQMECKIFIFIIILEKQAKEVLEILHSVNLIYLLLKKNRSCFYIKISRAKIGESSLAKGWDGVLGLLPRRRAPEHMPVPLHFLVPERGLICDPLPVL